jgi:AraC family transcriptional regulator
MNILAKGDTFGTMLQAPCADAVLSVHAPGEALPPHEHAGAYVCIVLGGAFSETRGARESRHRAGDIVFHPAGERHADRFGHSGGRCLNLHVPGRLVSRPEVRRATAAFRAAADALSIQSALGPRGDSLTAQSALAEMLGMLFESGIADADAVDRVAEALDDEPDRQWTLAELAALAERHPTHLARVFRAATGMSIGAYCRRRRLLALCIDLRCKDSALGELAQAHGYADQAHMNREFRRYAGCSPGAWRRRLR